MAAIRRESEVGPYIQQADVISDFDTYVLCCFESSRKVTKMTKFWYFGRLAPNESQNLLEIKEQH